MKTTDFGNAVALPQRRAAAAPAPRLKAAAAAAAGKEKTAPAGSRYSKVASPRIPAAAAPSAAAAAQPSRAATYAPGFSRAEAADPAPQPQQGRPTFKLNAPLRGGVVMNVPRTPEDVAKYLARMRKVIDEYEEAAMATILNGAGTSGAVDPQSIREARNQCLGVIAKIRSIAPPPELKNRHSNLADTLAEIGSFMENPGQAAGGGLKALGAMGPLLGRLNGSLSGYHEGVKACMAHYGLGPELDPFGGERQDHKQRLMDIMGNMQANMLKPKAPSAQQPTAGVTGAGIGNLGGRLLNGLGGSGLAGALGGGSSSGAGVGDLGQLINGIDQSALSGGAGGGGLGKMSPSSLGSSLGLGGPGGLERLQKLDMGSLLNLAGKELDSFGELSGQESGSGGAAPGLNLDPATLEKFGNMLNQLNGN